MNKAGKACDICGSFSSDVLIDMRQSIGSGRLSYLFCNNCGGLYQKDPPSEAELAEFYKRKSHKKGSMKNLLDYSAMKMAVNSLRAKWLLANIGASVSTKKMVDIGCGEGSLVKIFSDNGWDATGIELEDELVEFAAKHHGANVRQIFYDEKTFAPSSIGLFTMNHVLEHLYDPQKVLEAIRGQLADDGYLYAEVPTYILHSRNELANRVLASTHLRLYTAENLSVYLRRNGFEAVKTLPKVQYIPEHPSVGVLARKAPYQKEPFKCSTSYIKARSSVHAYRVNEAVRRILRPIKDCAKIVITKVFGRETLNRMRKNEKSWNGR